jgi:hypothetical protein
MKKLRSLPRRTRLWILQSTQRNITKKSWNMKKRNYRQSWRASGRKKTHPCSMKATCQSQYWSACSRINWIRSCSRPKSRKSLSAISSSKKCSKRRKTRSRSNGISKWAGLCQASIHEQRRDNLQSSTRWINRTLFWALLAPPKWAFHRDFTCLSHRQEQWRPKTKLQPKIKLREPVRGWSRRL